MIGEERLRSLDTLRKKDSLSSHTPNGTLGFSSADVNESNGKVQNPTFRCRVQHVATQRWAKPEQASDCSRLGTQNAPQWELQRKKPGESIIKAPGHQPRYRNIIIHTLVKLIVTSPPDLTTMPRKSDFIIEYISVLYV